MHYRNKDFAMLRKFLRMNIELVCILSNDSSLIDNNVNYDLAMS